jgi:hypothetical protein
MSPTLVMISPSFALTRRFDSAGTHSLATVNTFVPWLVAVDRIFQDAPADLVSLTNTCPTLDAAARLRAFLLRCPLALRRGEG